VGTVRLDYTNAMEAAVGAASGLSTGELDALRAPSATALLSVLKRRDVDLPWLDLPYQESVVQEVAEFANDVRGRFKNVVVLGIGGSALGNTALHTALNSPFHNLDPPPGIPRLFVLDNVDPDLVGELLDLLNPAETLFNVVSKSGSTAETVSQFLVFRQALVDCIGAEDHVEHICVTTDPMQGPLFEVAVREGYRRFAVPDGVGGRFSVLSAVGLVPAALVGIDVQGLCRGAAAMDERCKNPELLENPALVHAALQFLLHTRKQKPIAVTFSYSHRLRDCADWYAQLLAESIGKRRNRAGEEVFCGPSPVRAVGVTDQHSQVQLYTEGPFDKWFMFLAVENHDHQVVIPPLPCGSHPGRALWCRARGDPRGA